MTRALAILGAGGHGSVVADCAEVLGWDRIDLFDDQPAASARGLWPVIGGSADFRERAGDYDAVIVGIGANRVRLAFHRELAERGVTIATLIHPAATVSRHARIGAGTVVFAGAVVNVGAALGQACIINTCAGVDHDCQLADGVHISPGAHLGGGVLVGECSWIGIGAAVRHGAVVGRDAQVGAAAAVVSIVPDDAVVAGVPAKPLRQTPNA